MREVLLQIDEHGNFHPYTIEDKEAAKSYKPFQILRAKISGVRKPRSYQQLKLFFACCKTVAENTEDIQWNTKDKVKFQIKVALHFVDDSVIAVRPDGQVVFQYRSIAFKELPHMAACKFFVRAFEIMAKKIGVPVETLLKNAEEQNG